MIQNRESCNSSTFEKQEPIIVCCKDCFFLSLYILSYTFLSLQFIISVIYCHEIFEQQLNSTYSLSVLWLNINSFFTQYLTCLKTSRSLTDKLSFDVGLQEDSIGTVWLMGTLQSSYSFLLLLIESSPPEWPFHVSLTLSGINTNGRHNCLCVCVQ